jgi:hypothetical protein
VARKEAEGVRGKRAHLVAFPFASQASSARMSVRGVSSGSISIREFGICVGDDWTFFLSGLFLFM